MTENEPDAIFSEQNWHVHKLCSGRAEFREPTMIKLTTVESKSGYRLLLRFSDDTSGVYDFMPFVEAATEMTAPLSDPQLLALLHRAWRACMAQWIRPECRIIASTPAGIRWLAEQRRSGLM